VATVDFNATELENLRGQLDTTTQKVKLVDRRLAVMEASVDSPPWTGAGGPGVADFLSQTRGSPGFVTDQAIAREAVPCICYEIQSRTGTSELCFKHGIVGALDKDQIGLYCQEKEQRQPTPEMKARLEDFQESAAACKVAISDVPKGEELDPWLGCMTQELRMRNRRLSGAAIAQDQGLVADPVADPPDDPTPAYIEPPADNSAGGFEQAAKEALTNG
jgi:hypothetical protein